MKELEECPFCKGKNTLVQKGTRVWLGTRYGEPTHYEIMHWCEDNRSIIHLRAKTENEVIIKWNQRK